MRTVTLILAVLAFTSATATKSKTQSSRYRSWNSRMYPVWRNGDPRFRDCWSGGEVTFDIRNDAPTLTGAKATFNVDLHFPPNQTLLADGQVVWARNCTVNGTEYQQGQAVYPDQGSNLTGVFPDGSPLTGVRNRRPRYVFVWKTWGRYWQVADGPSTTLTIGTDNVPLGSYNMEVVIYHCRGKDKFIPLGYASTVFTITDQIPFSVSLTQINDVNQDDQNFIQNRAIAFGINLHDPSQYLSGSEITFNWDFGDNTGTLISRELTATHTYLLPGTYKPQVVLMASIPSGCVDPTAAVPTAVSAAPAVVVMEPTPAANPPAPVVEGVTMAAPDVTASQASLADDLALVASVQPDAAEVEEGAEPEFADEAAAIASTVAVAMDTIAPLPTSAVATEGPATGDTIAVDAATPAAIATEGPTVVGAAVDAAEDVAAVTAAPVVEGEVEEATDVIVADLAASVLPAAEGAAVVPTEAAQAEAEAPAVEEALAAEPEADAAAGTDNVAPTAVEQPAVSQAAVPVEGELEAAVPVEGELEAAVPVEGELEAAVPVEGELEAAVPVEGELEAAVPVEGELEAAVPVEGELDAAVPVEGELEAAVPVEGELEAAVPVEGELEAAVPVEGELEAAVPVEVAAVTEAAQVALVLVKRQAPELEAGCTVYRYGSHATSVDIIQGIESAEIVQVTNVVSLTTEVEQNAVDLTITCQGSLPSEVCTVVSDADCVTPMETVCSAAAPSPDCQLVLRQFFNDSGVFCINVSLTNDVSLAVASARVSVTVGDSDPAAGTLAAVLGVLVLACVAGSIALMYRRCKQYQPLRHDHAVNVSGRSTVTSVPLLLWNLLSRQSPGESRPLLQSRVV